ncbi:MAG: hypothetical protein JWM85_861, partial [Acidimicrobiaceae bacterium]|nr:hypothetical protein [Acidimicrobiaceae bacterium]
AIAYQLADELIAPQAPWSGGRRHLRGEVMLPDRPAHRNPDGSSWDERALRTSGGDGADTDGY